MTRALWMMTGLAAFSTYAFAAGVSCEDLAKVSVPHTEITLAQSVPAG